MIWLILIIVLTLSGSERKGVPQFEHVAPDRPTEVGRQPARFTEAFRWIDGVAVEVVQIEQTTLLASMPVDSTSARVGDPCSELTIVVRNDSDRQVGVAVTARLRFGRDLATAGAYVATPGHTEHLTVQYINPQRSPIHTHLGFVLPEGARDDVLLEVGIDNWRHEQAVFAGTLTTR